MAHVVNEVQKELVRAPETDALTSQTHGELDAMGVHAVTMGVPRRNTAVKLGRNDEVECMVSTVVVPGAWE
jgi:hypothetical protein